MSDNTQSYEIMFLLDAGNPDFNASSEPARVALEKNEAQILSIKPWDERRLAYEIHGRRRGLYVLAYFKARGDGMLRINMELSGKLEQVLR